MIRVLVVDDDFRVAAIHSGHVESAGMQVVGTAHTAADALRLVGTEKPDLVLLDGYLPDRSGLDLVAELAGRDVDVFLVTADDAAESVRRAVGAGALNYLVKPFDREQLVTRLAAWARYRSRVSRGTLSQEQVDAAFAALHEGDSRPTPKGQSPVTARLVRAHLAGADGPVTAAELASELGIGRATAQRYLSSLVDEGGAVMRLRYGSTGRPEHEYRAKA